MRVAVTRPRLLLLLPSTTYRAAAFVEAARRLDVDLTVGSDHRSVFDQHASAGLLALDLSDPTRAADQAASFARQHPLSAVFGVDDDTGAAAAAIGARLGLHGNSLEAALAARDKRRQRERLRAAGVPVPNFALRRPDEDVARVARESPYPCVLKPLRLSASRGVMRANHPAELVAAAHRLRAILEAPDAAACGDDGRQYLVEDYVPGPEFALEGLLQDGRLRVLALFDKPDPLEGPFFEETIYLTPSRLPADAQQRIAECAERAALAIGLRRGPVHAELRYNPRGPWLIELAARPIGGRCSAVLRFRDGSSLEDVLLRDAFGLPIPTLEREETAAGVMMIPVPRGGVLREVHGAEAARAVPGVDAVEITAHRGQTLVPWPEGNRYPGFIFARGETPEAVERALRAAHRELEFVLEGR